MGDYNEALDWRINLLTTYTHNSELQATTAPPLISTIHKSPQHSLRLFQPAVSLPAVPWQRFLTMEILQLHALKSFLHRLPYETDLVRVRARVRVTLRLAVYSQSRRLGVKPLETHDQYFYQLNPCGHSPYVTSSLTRRWVCLL
jgi:hypothetical protein